MSWDTHSPLQVTQNVGDAPIPPDSLSIQRPGMVKLTMLIDFAIQKVYTELERLVELLPSKTDMEKKISIAEFLNQTRLIFIRILALVTWANSAERVDKSHEILEYLEEQRFHFIDTANALTFNSREVLANATLPVFSIILGVDIFTRKSYTRLPLCLKDKIVPASNLTVAEKEDSLIQLNKVILARLRGTQIPLQMQCLKVSNGYLSISTPGEFKIKMTLMSDDPQFPWRILGIDLFVKDPESPGRKIGMNHEHSLFLQSRVQTRILDKNFDKRPPLVHIYYMLPMWLDTDDFTLSIQLEILQEQTIKLMKTQSGNLVAIDKYHTGDHLKISYWRNRIRRSGMKPPQVYAVTIFIDRKGSGGGSLKVMHSPDLTDYSQCKIGRTISGKDLSVKQLLARTISVRSQVILKILQRKLLCLTPSPTSFTNIPLQLEVALLSPSLPNELLRMHVDPFIGLIRAYLPLLEEAEHNHISETSFGPKRCLTALQDLFSAEVTTDSGGVGHRRRMALELDRLRHWLAKERVKRSLSRYRSWVRPLVTLPLWTSAKDPNTENMTFFSLLCHSDHYLLVYPESSDNLTVVYRVFFLATRPCTPAGQVLPHAQHSLLKRPLLLRRIQGSREIARDPQPPESSQTSSIHKAGSKRGLLEAVTEYLYPTASSTSPSKRLRLSDEYQYKAGVITSPSEVADDPMMTSRNEEALVPDLGEIIARCEAVSIMQSLVWELTSNQVEFTFDTKTTSPRIVNDIQITSFPSPDKLWHKGCVQLKEHFIGCTIRLQSTCSPRSLRADWLMTGHLSANQMVTTDTFVVHSLAHIRDAVRQLVDWWHSMCVMQQISADLQQADTCQAAGIICEKFDWRVFRFMCVSNSKYFYTVSYQKCSGFSIELGSIGRCPVNPHVLNKDHLLKHLERSGSLLSLVNVIEETQDFLLAAYLLLDPDLVVHAVLLFEAAYHALSLQPDSEVTPIRNLYLLAFSTHDLVVIYRSQLALQISLSKGSGSGLTVQLSDAADKMVAKNTVASFHPLPAFDKLYASLQDAFQMDIEADSWLGLTVNQLAQLTQAPSLQCPSPLEAFLGSALLFHTAHSQSLRAQLSTLEGGCQGSGLSLTQPASGAGCGYTLCLSALRTGVEVPVWRLTFRLLEPVVETPTLAELAPVFEEYFHTRVSVTPFLPNALTSFLRLLSLPLHILHDLSHIINWELHPSTRPPTPTHHHTLTLVLLDCLVAPGQPAILHRSSTRVGGNNDVYLQFNLTQPSNPCVSYAFPAAYTPDTNSVAMVAPIGAMAKRWRLSKQHLSVLFALRKLPAERNANSGAGVTHPTVSPIMAFLSSIARAPPLW